MDFATALHTFFGAPTTRLIIFGAILDLLLGVAASIRDGAFDWLALGNWYRTNVLPYVLGYFVLWIFATYGLSDVIGAYGGNLGANLLAAPAVISIGRSITRSLARLGFLPGSLAGRDDIPVTLAPDELTTTTLETGSTLTVPPGSTTTIVTPAEPVTTGTPDKVKRSTYTRRHQDPPTTEKPGDDTTTPTG